MRNRNLFLCVTVLYVAGTSTAWALPGVPLYLAPSTSWGYSSTTTETGKQAPKMTQFGLGVTAAYTFMADMLMAGITSDFRFLSQYSSTGSAGANFRGTRWNLVSPTVGARFMGITALADVQFLGDYKLKNLAADGGEVAFKKPFGFRLRAMYPAMEMLSIGAQFEQVTFSKISNSKTGESDLTEKRKLWQLGLVAAYEI